MYDNEPELFDGMATKTPVVTEEILPESEDFSR
jgi:hypothetical protein